MGGRRGRLLHSSCRDPRAAASAFSHLSIAPRATPRVRTCPAEPEHHQLTLRQAQMISSATPSPTLTTSNTPKGTPMDSAGAVLATVTLRAELRTAPATGGDTLPSGRPVKRIHARRVARGHHLPALGGAR